MRVLTDQMMIAWLMTVRIRLIGDRHGVPVMMLLLMALRIMLLIDIQYGVHRMMVHRRTFASLSRRAFHCDGRERLNRKAHCQQNDNEEFAPVGHRREV
jgi:hypothetical protein